MEKSSFSERFGKNMDKLLGNKAVKDKKVNIANGVIMMFPFIIIYTLIEPIFLLFRNKKQHDKEQEA